MISDYMSRHAFKAYTNFNSTEDNVRFIASHSVPRALNLSYVALEKKDDETLQNFILSVKTNRWNKQMCAFNRSYKYIQN